MAPVPTLYGNEQLEEYDEKPSLLPTPTPTRKPPPTVRNSSLPDEMEKFKEMDVVRSIDCLSESCSPKGFSFKRLKDYVLFYKIFLDEASQAPCVESIRVDQDLHVKLHYKGSSIPLPEWFSDSRYRMTSAGMLENFVTHIHNVIEDVPWTVPHSISKVLLIRSM